MSRLLLFIIGITTVIDSSNHLLPHFVQYLFYFIGPFESLLFSYQLRGIKEHCSPIKFFDQIHCYWSITTIFLVNDFFAPETKFNLPCIHSSQDEHTYNFWPKFIDFIYIQSMQHSIDLYKWPPWTWPLIGSLIGCW